MGGDNRRSKFVEWAEDSFGNIDLFELGSQEPVDTVEGRSIGDRKYINPDFKSRFAESTEVVEDQNVTTAQFCDVCGAEVFNVEPHGSLSSVIAEIVDSREIVIKSSVQDSGELFVALLDETSADANSLDNELSGIELVESVEMVEGGLLVEPGLWVGECDECGNQSVFENRENAHPDVEPIVQTHVNRLRALKVMCSEGVVEQFEAFQEGELDVSEMIDAKLDRDKALSKFAGNGGSGKLRGMSPPVPDSAKVGLGENKNPKEADGKTPVSEIEFDNVYDKGEGKSIANIDLSDVLEMLDEVKSEDNRVEEFEANGFETLRDLEMVSMYKMREIAGMGNTVAARLRNEVENEVYDENC